ncbi:hypothetical protein PGT21_023634 [Puccinia graminis f. sp. tritici]|uniref:Uncharacterized protein n=1 Tax=Puccinia graminis f. sp. tritici TaxID=56615 RepID=A0A5B0S517_PUCGR|nr:hypothetical protein PGT21_023634 [Puccinia graminis f. sp. tritici]KAA1131794.1 hypothetical protein PGTUg99_025905 [Puccinia graminis f. sp. tritici]
MSRTSGLLKLGSVPTRARCQSFWSPLGHKPVVRSNVCYAHTSPSGWSAERKVDAFCLLAAAGAARVELEEAYTKCNMLQDDDTSGTPLAFQGKDIEPELRILCTQDRLARMEVIGPQWEKIKVGGAGLLGSSAADQLSNKDQAAQISLRACSRRLTPTLQLRQQFISPVPACPVAPEP